MIKNHESVSIEIERTIQRLINQHKESQLRLVIHPELNDYLSGRDKKFFESMTKKGKGEIVFESNDELHLNAYEFYSLADGNQLEL